MIRRPIEDRPVPTIFTHNNPYGYRLNINHPKIKPFYDRFKKWKGIALIPSDAERREFEDYMVGYIEKHKAHFQ